MQIFLPMFELGHDQGFNQKVHLCLVICRIFGKSFHSNRKFVNNLSRHVSQISLIHFTKSSMTESPVCKDHVLFPRKSFPESETLPEGKEEKMNRNRRRKRKKSRSKERMKIRERERDKKRISDGKVRPPSIFCTLLERHSLLSHEEISSFFSLCIRFTGYLILDS